MKRKMRKVWAFVLTLAVVLTSVTWPEVQKASAAVPPVDKMTETDLLDSSLGAKLVSNDSSHDSTDSESGDYKYDGYLQTIDIAKATGDYFKVSFTIAEGTESTTEIVTFQPFDTSWSGWQENTITLADAQLDSANSQYTAYISIADIKASYTGSGTLKGINFGFVNKEPAVTLTELTMLTAKELTPPEAGLEDTSILDSKLGTKVTSNDASHDSTDEEGAYKYDGYLQTVNIEDVTGKYFKVSFTTDSALTDTDEVFTFQPFDTGWSGWQENPITFGDAQYDGEKNQYTAWISIAAIKESYTNGGTLKAINLSFVNKEPAVTITEFAMSTPSADITPTPTPDPDKVAEDAVTIPSTEDGGHETLQEIKASDVNAATGITLAQMQSGNAKVYIHVTKCSVYSRLKVRGGNINTGSFSNKELIGVKCTKSTNTNYKLHAGYGTDKEGTGVGAAGSANYVFPDCGLTKGTTLDDTGIRLTRMTTDVECKIIGVVFGSGESISVAEDGTITEGFDPSRIVLESQAADSTDDKDYAAKQEAIRQQWRTNLANSIAYAKALDASKYQPESFAKLADAITAAEAVYAKEDETRDNYKDARDDLELVKTALLFKNSTDAGNPKDFRELDKETVIKEMGAGINLGNTLDGGLNNATETNWQAYKTTKAYIKALHDAGYNTVRVPVTWNGYINDDDNYSIDEAWISRVQEIVDYCIDQDMYCIINIHHDGAANHDERGNNPECWLNTAADDMDAVYEKFEGTWRTIANRFKDYDEHLIFESMNEVTDAHDGTANEDTKILNSLNQLFVNTVRATGSNNAKRWLAFTGRFAAFSSGTTLPDDTAYNEEMRMMFSVHIYKGAHSGRWSLADLKTWQSSLSSTVKNVQKLSSDIPIYVGEYGVTQQAQSGSETGYNNVERALYSEFANATCQFYGVCPIVWDQGDGNYVTTETNTGLFNYWNRPALEPVYADTIEGMMRGTYLSTAGKELSALYNEMYMSYGHPTTSDNGVSTNPTITEITEISLKNGEDAVDTKLTMKAGERVTLAATTVPEATNDIVLWSTDDDAIVTVSNGQLHAKGAGVTTVHAYSQSKSVTKDIQVVVSPSGKETATAVKTDKPYYEVEEGKQITIQTTLLPADSKDSVTYTSSNPEIATVSSTGIVTAEAPGSTYVIVTAASGVSTIVNIKVLKSKSSGTVDVALNVMIGATTEQSAPVTLTGDGQYTVTYDMATDLSDKGQQAGLTELKDMTAVYIRDCNKLKPVVEKAQIRYDKVTVNDTELTITKPDFKDALKPNGQFDTNDPINGWDGSAVAEVETDSGSHTVDFVGITNPTKISVTFTIKDMVFFPTEEKENEATEMTISGDNKVLIPAIGETKDVEITLNPVDTDSYVTFYSTNSSVIAVDNTVQKVDENGKIKLSLTAVSEGTATITAITENGLKVFYSVGVGVTEVADPTDPTPPGLDGSEIEDPTDPTPTPSSDPTPTPGSDPTPTPGGTNKPVIKPTPGAKAQSIVMPKTISKPIGSKKFNLNAKASGNGKLTYKTSNAKVAAVDAKGNVTVKKYGVAKITVTAAATASYKAATAVCTVKVVPKAVKLKKVKALKGKKAKVTWKRDKSVSGYQIKYSADKKFKKKVKTVVISKNKITSKVIKKLKKGKNYVKIRAYKKAGKTKLYGKFSKAKKVKIK